jgi:hypothetical protein
VNEQRLVPQFSWPSELEIGAVCVVSVNCGLAPGGAYHAAHPDMDYFLSRLKKEETATARIFDHDAVKKAFEARTVRFIETRRVGAI